MQTPNEQKPLPQAPAYQLPQQQPPSFQPSQPHPPSFQPQQPQFPPFLPQQQQMPPIQPLQPRPFSFQPTQHQQPPPPQFPGGPSQTLQPHPFQGPPTPRSPVPSDISKGSVTDEKGPSQPAPSQPPHFQSKPVMGTQPGPTPMMTLGSAGGNRNAANVPMMGGQRDWSHGLCACCGDCGTCICAFWCPGRVYGLNKARLDHLQYHGVPLPKESRACCNGDAWLYFTLAHCFGSGWVLQIGQRTTIRQRYSISGGLCGDCCTSWCCSPCALVQQSREIKLEERSFVPAAVYQGY